MSSQTYFDEGKVKETDNSMYTSRGHFENFLLSNIVPVQTRYNRSGLVEKTTLAVSWNILLVPQVISFPFPFKWSRFKRLSVSQCDKNGVSRDNTR